MKYEIKILEGDGSYDSEESLKILKEEADIVVTNPPFSKFRDYIRILMEYKKKFIIVGPQNAITYKEIFPLIKENEMWLGYPFQRGDAYFAVPSEIDTNQYAAGVFNPETNLVHFRNCIWYTNLDIAKRHEDLILFKQYKGHEEEYPKYDNYDAINVDKTKNIPLDYTGYMGVPITFLDKYNPSQFRILGTTYKWNMENSPIKVAANPKFNAIVAGKEIYKRIFIQRI